MHRSGLQSELGQIGAVRGPCEVVQGRMADDAAESVEISTGRSSDDDGFDGAYLKPKTKAPPRAPPKASAPPKAAKKEREDSQLLESIPEDKQ